MSLSFTQVKNKVLKKMPCRPLDQVGSIFEVTFGVGFYII